jgi:hypothetical protein
MTTVLLPRRDAGRPWGRQGSAQRKLVAAAVSVTLRLVTDLVEGGPETNSAAELLGVGFGVWIYHYLGFTNATAFSPTDVMPLARWAKLAMTVQATGSLAVLGLVIARAVNILK